MIWLPEIEQGTLNLICSLVFATTDDHRKRVAAANAGQDVARSDDSVSDITEARQVQHLENIFRTFVSRSESLSAVTGFRNSTVDATNPAFIGQMIMQARDKGKISSEILHERIDGLRFLPMPKQFVAFREIVSKEVLTKYPLAKWLELIPTQPSGSDHQATISSVAEPDHVEAIQ